MKNSSVANAQRIYSKRDMSRRELIRRREWSYKSLAYVLILDEKLHTSFTPSAFSNNVTIKI